MSVPVHKLFLEGDDLLRALQLAAQRLVFLLQALDLSRLPALLPLRATPLRHRTAGPNPVQLSPRRQLRREKSLPPEQATDLPCRTTALCLLNDLLSVLQGNRATTRISVFYSG